LFEETRLWIHYIEIAIFQWRKYDIKNSSAELLLINENKMSIFSKKIDLENEPESKKMDDFSLWKNHHCYNSIIILNESFEKFYKVWDSVINGDWGWSIGSWWME